MPEEYNVYCDESCHLEYDRSNTMVLGAIWLPKQAVRDVNDRIRDIKRAHGLPAHRELKWTRVSPAQISTYAALMNCFFDDDSLSFRALVVRGKDQRLDHKLFYGQDHDQWYYKMYYQMLINIFSSDNAYDVYVDIKDTLGARKISELHKILCTKLGDRAKQVIKRIQIVRSHEVQILQLTDLLIGALAYHERDLAGSSAKLQLIELIKSRAHHSMQYSSPQRDKKFNVLFWRPQEA